MRDRIYTIVLWGLVIVLTLIPFFRVGFTTGDDLEYYLTRLQGFRYWLTDAAAYAQGQGRFFFYLSKPFGNIPYLIDNFYFTKTVQYLSLLAAYGLFAYFVFKIFKSRTLSLVLLLLLITWTQITFNHHIPTIAYPFSFSFVFILCLWACLLFIRYTETARYGLVIWSAVLFFIAALFYENCLLCSGVFGLYILIRNIRIHSLKNVFKTPAFYKEILPFCLAGMVYLSCYFGYRFLVTSDYNGTALAGHFSLSHFWRILWHCTVIVLPALNFFMEQSVMAFGDSCGTIAHTGFALLHAPARVYILAATTCLLFVYYVRKNDVRIPCAQLIAGIVIAVGLSFFFHSLIGATEKYNAEWYSWMRGYTTSFYALFGITLTISLALFGLMQVCEPYKWLYRTMLTAATALLFISLVLTGYANEYISREWQHSQNRFCLLDGMAQSGYFAYLPEGSILYGADLQKPTPYAAQVTYSDYIIGHYIRIKSGRHYFYEVHPGDLSKTAAQHPSARIYRLNLSKPDQHDGMLLSVADLGVAGNLKETPVDSMPALATDCFYYAPGAGFQVIKRKARRP